MRLTIPARQIRKLALSVQDAEGIYRGGRTGGCYTIRTSAWAVSGCVPATATKLVRDMCDDLGWKWPEDREQFVQNHLLRLGSSPFELLDIKQACKTIHAS